MWTVAPRKPGPSGIGVIIDGCASGPVHIAKWMGHQDNNVAEYVALMEALQYAVALNAKALHVYSDSQVVAPDARRVHLPQLSLVLPALDLPQAGPRSKVLHLTRLAREQRRGESLGEYGRAPALGLTMNGE